ncbi:hypothetical protein P280DRAFT_523150 [Massarina eburnea CBS 473.64]|uniref:Uncharacterized protein n=1 Tax=Massarina eburnea CBS 473.64 TaxID=1395130 RepID=A0A6A6RJQ7_9PLEO|nr:hypothetical protein P280DRAFT_523150 [Massarina eburnea CBS 473.64]
MTSDPPPYEAYLAASSSGSDADDEDGLKDLAASTGPMSSSGHSSPEPSGWDTVNKARHTPAVVVDVLPTLVDKKDGIYLHPKYFDPQYYLRHERKQRKAALEQQKVVPDSGHEGVDSEEEVDEVALQDSTGIHRTLKKTDGLLEEVQQESTPGSASGHSLQQRDANPQTHGPLEQTGEEEQDYVIGGTAQSTADCRQQFPSRSSMPPDDTNSANEAQDTEIANIEWELVTGSLDDRLILGITNRRLLRIRLRDVTTQKEQTFTFDQKITWSNQEDLASLNEWRHSIFLQHGLHEAEDEKEWTPEEETWLRLFCAKIHAALQAGHNILTPTAKMIAKEFNEAFEGKTLRHAIGYKLKPRGARSKAEIDEKIENDDVVQNIVNNIENLSGQGPVGDMYIPVITETEVVQFRNSGVVAVDDPRDTTKNVAWGYPEGSFHAIKRKEEEVRRKRDRDVGSDESEEGPEKRARLE